MIHIATSASGFTPEEYCGRFLVAGKRVSLSTIKRRCENGQLRHRAEKLSGEWIIMVPDVEVIEPIKKEVALLNAKHFSWR